MLGVAMMLMGENSHAVAERVAEKVKDIQKQLPAGVVIKSGVQSEEPCPPNHSHGDDEPFRRGVAGHSGAADPSRKLARRTRSLPRQFRWHFSLPSPE